MDNKERLNKTIIAVGRKGTGKTTIGQFLASKTKKKIIVVDTDDHPSYSDYELYKITDLRNWKSGNIKIITSEPEIALMEINKHCSNAFVLLEDAAKYITANVQRGVKSFVIDHRKRNFDLLIMFHFLGDIPPYLAKQYDTMIIFKTNDNLDVRQNKFSNWHKIAAVAKRVLKNPNFNYCEKINVDE